MEAYIITRNLIEKFVKNLGNEFDREKMLSVIFNEKLGFLVEPSDIFKTKAFETLDNMKFLAEKYGYEKFDLEHIHCSEDRFHTSPSILFSLMLSHLQNKSIYDNQDYKKYVEELVENFMVNNDIDREDYEKLKNVFTYYNNCEYNVKYELSLFIYSTKYDYNELVSEIKSSDKYGILNYVNDEVKEFIYEDIFRKRYEDNSKSFNMLFDYVIRNGLHK